MFLPNTIDDILSHIEADTEIITVLDGDWPLDPIEDDPRVILVHLSESIGQRAATNMAARISQAKYVMKVDAHCAFDQGFDRIMLEHMNDNWTMVPVMRNLHVFDWVCKDCQHRRYQGRSGPCTKCGGETEMDVVWIPKHNPASTSYCFDSEPHFQYFRAFKKRPEGKGKITPTMSLQGSCWMLTRDKYFELNVCDDETFGSWGSQGIEVACKTWLSGGQVMCNHHTWYAHMFRTQGGDFGFPYSLSGNQVRHAKQQAKKLFYGARFPQQKYPLSWLVEKFWPVRGWTEDDLKELKKMDGTDKKPSKGIVYYTSNNLDPIIMSACQSTLLRTGLPITSVSLKPIDFGDNIVITGHNPGYIAMFKQILAGIEACDADIIFLCEHDVLYHPSHFDFTPVRDDLFYYNNNVWKVDAETGRALYYISNHTSQLCAHRSLLLKHYAKRDKMIRRRGGFTRRMGFEPGTHNRSDRVDDYWHDTWESEYPNLDLRHGKNLTVTRWKKSQFRNKRFTKGWKEAEEIPGWGRVKGRMEEILWDAQQQQE